MKAFTARHVEISAEALYEHLVKTLGMADAHPFEQLPKAQQDVYRAQATAVLLALNGGRKG